MIKIMFVCHGNICRSPMAEFIFKDMVRKIGREDEFVIASSATSTEEIWNGIGNPVYPPAKAELEKHGISCKGKRAVQLKKTDYDKYDLFLCMDNRNVTNTMRIFGNDTDHKVRKLLKDKEVSEDMNFKLCKCNNRQNFDNTKKQTKRATLRSDPTQTVR